MSEPGATPPEVFDDGYAVRPMRREDEPAVMALFDSLFPRPRTVAEWRWRYEEVPGTAPFRAVVEKDGRVVGHNGWARHRVHFEGRAELCAQGGDAMVHPDHRGHQATRRTAGYAGQHAGWRLKLSFPIDDVVWRRREEVPEFVSRIPVWVRWLSVDGVRASRSSTPPILAAAVVAAGRAAGAAARAGSGGWRVDVVTDLPEDLDELAASSASFARAVRIRDRAYLRWRWWDRPDGPRPLTVARYRDGRLGGFAVAGPDDRTSERLGVTAWRVHDFLARSAAPGVSLLSEAVARARADGADIIQFDLLDPRRWSRWMCRASGFADRGVGVNVTTIHPQGPGPLRVHPSDWYLTLGDTDMA